MKTVYFDFELFNTNGDSLGICADWVQTFGNLTNAIASLLENGFITESGYLSDAKEQWGLYQHADMSDEQYSFVKDWFEKKSALFPSVLAQIMQKFTD